MTVLRIVALALLVSFTIALAASTIVAPAYASGSTKSPQKDP